MERGLLEFDGGTLAWESSGEGPGVVFLHPGLWDSRVWDEQFGGFSSTYRVLRYDFRGYGRSSRPEAGKPYSHVSDLAAVMDAAGVERVALIGNSMGGGVAVDFARQPLRDGAHGPPVVGRGDADRWGVPTPRLGAVGVRDRGEVSRRYFRASSFFCCAAAMILSARWDGTSS